MPVFRLCQCRKGDLIPLSFSPLQSGPAHVLETERPSPSSLPRPSVGTFFVKGEDRLFQVESYASFFPKGRLHSEILPVVRALKDIEEGVCMLEAKKEGFSLGVVTLSDKGFRDERVDESGPAIFEALSKALPISLVRFHLLPDEPRPLKALLASLSLQEGFDLVVSTGGTGVSPRDITLNVAKQLFDFELPGFAVAMTEASLKVTPKAVISRSCAGVIGETLLICLPGSKKAVRENLEAVTGALKHAIEKIHGDTSDCARH